MKYLIIIAILIQDTPKNIVDYFKLFPYKSDFTLQESEKNEVTIDQANAYIKILNLGTDDYNFDSELAFTYFTTTTKTKVFAKALIERGPNTDHFDCSFYKLNGDQWIDVTADVLPKDFSLQSFGGDSTEIDAVGTLYQLEFTLPQLGSNVVVEPHPVGETDQPFNNEANGYARYLAVFAHLKKDKLTLKWNREKAVFEIAK